MNDRSANDPAYQDEPFQPFEQARLQLAQMHVGAGTTLRQVWLNLAELVSSTLNVERAGVWVLVDEGCTLRCRYLLQRSSRDVFQGAVLRAQDFPEYFNALHTHRTVAADNAVAAAQTKDLRESYLEPLGITSLLDAPIYVEGRVVGVVCHEHIGAPRTWNARERDFASCVADNIARLYQEHERQHAQTTLRWYERHLMELHRMEAVGRMAAGIAHDFRGILGAAMGYAELIRRIPDIAPDADRYAQRIVETLQRGGQLTQEVMSFGKDSPISPRVIDVRVVIESLSNMFRVLLGSHIRLQLNHERSVSRVFMDPSQLERTLLNLVLNARDAMSAGGTLTISAEDALVDDEDDESSTYVALAVADTGVGMDAATREHVFQPFFTTKGEAGTGLGLAIVDQIVGRAGGFIRIESELGRGTTVRVLLPRIAGAVS